MKIAQVSVYYHPAMIGGIEWYIRNISKELVKRGHEVHIFTVNSKDGKALGPADEIFEGVYIHRLPLLFDKSYRLKFWPTLLLHILRTKFDIIHVYDYLTTHAMLVSLLTLLKDVRTVLMIYDVHHLVPRRAIKYIPLALFDKYFSRLILRRYDRLLIRTSLLIGPILKMGAKKEQLVITPSGIRSESLKEYDGNAFRKKYDIDGRIILYLGRLHPMKGPQVLIKAIPHIIQEVSAAKFVFVGPDQINYEKDLKNLSKKLHVEDHVFFLGPIYDIKEKMQAYASCDVFVLPSGYEGFGQVLVEAMAQGKPIVATNAGSIPNVVTNRKEGFLVNYGDHRDLASRIKQLLLSPELARALGNEGRKKAREYTYEELAVNLERVYLELSR
ncbi:MAG: glycosyltransferase family 4 protein [Promethearchaeota archaeon]